MSDLAWVAGKFAARRAGHSLPQGLYTDPRAFEFDMMAIYGQNWLMAGFECELPTPGSYLSMMIGKWPARRAANCPATHARSDIDSLPATSPPPCDRV